MKINRESFYEDCKEDIAKPVGSLQLCAGQFDPIPMVAYTFGLTPILEKLQIIKWNAAILILLMISQW